MSCPTCSGLRLGKYSVYNKECISQSWATCAEGRETLLSATRPDKCGSFRGREMSHLRVRSSKSWPARSSNYSRSPETGRKVISGSSVLRYSWIVVQKTQTICGPSPGRRLRFAFLLTCVPGSSIQLSILPHTKHLRAIYLGSYSKKVRFREKNFFEELEDTHCFKDFKITVNLSIYILSLFILPLVEVSTVYTHSFVLGDQRGWFQHSGPNPYTLFWNSNKNHQETMVKVSCSVLSSSVFAAWGSSQQRQFYTSMIVIIAPLEHEKVWLTQVH